MNPKASLVQEIEDRSAVPPVVDEEIGIAVAIQVRGHVVLVGEPDPKHAARMIRGPAVRTIVPELRGIGDALVE